MAVLTKPGITIDDFELLPDALAHYHELVNGELVDVSGNTPSHNLLRDFLVTLLKPLVDTAGVGKIIAEQEFDFDGNAHGPDVALIGPANISRIERKKRVQKFVPDLAIEIVSDHDTFRNVMQKANRYRRCGTKEVWVFSPDARQAFVQSEQRNAILDDQQMFESPLIPGLSIRLGDLYDRAD